MFDDPGDLGFFDQKDDVVIPEEPEHDMFYEPAPGEEDTNGRSDTVQDL